MSDEFDRDVVAARGVARPQIANPLCRRHA